MELLRDSLVLKVLELYKELDEEIKNFKDLSGLECPDGCGHCCEKEDLETTVLEFLPLAVHLWKTQKAEAWLEGLDKKDSASPCIFYRPDPLVKGNGRCEVYPLRGFICRLFGFSARKDKTGAKQLCACADIKSKLSGEFEKTAPLITSFSARLMCIDPYLGGRFLPVNTAIKTAIEKIAFSEERGAIAC